MISALLLFLVLHKILGILCLIDDFLAFLNVEESSLTYQGVICRFKNQMTRAELKKLKIFLEYLVIFESIFSFRGGS